MSRLSALLLMLTMVPALSPSPAAAQGDKPEPAEPEQIQETAAPEDGAEAEQPGDEQEFDPEELKSFLDAIQVTATRSRAEDFQVPYAVEPLPRRELLERRQVRSLPEALEQTPGIVVQKTSHGQGSPFIRGFTGYRTLLMVDGIRLNNSVFRDGPNQYWNTVDPWSLDQFELVKGPTSVLYGSDAIGGTANVVSQGPTLGLYGPPVAGRLYLRYSDAEDSGIGRLQVQGRAGEKVRFIGGITSKDFGDIEGGGSVGVQPRTGYDELDGDFKAEFRLSDRRTLTAAFSHVEIDDAWRTHRTIFSIPWRGTGVGDELRRSLDQRRTLSYLTFTQEGDSRLFDTLTATLSHQEQDEERVRIRSDERLDRQGFTVGTTGATLQLAKADSKSLWTYGFELYHDDVDSFRLDFNADGSFRGEDIQGQVADDATYDLLGFYLQNERPLGDRTTLTLGARYTYAEADAEKVKEPQTGEQIAVSGSWDNLVGSARLLFRLDEEDRWRLFAGLSQAFRAPNLSDLTRFDTARSNEIETPAPGLESEEFLAFELGVKGRLQRASLELAYFHTDISDMIIRVPTGRVIESNNEITKRNGGDGYVQGIEFRGTLEINPDFTLYGNYAWQDGEVDTFPTSDPVLVREPIDRLMPQTAHLGLRWHPAKTRRYWAEALATFVDDADKLSTRDREDSDRIPPGGTPGYELLTLRGGFQFTHSLGIVAAVENLTDEEYRAHGSGQNEPGRNFVLTVSAEF